jgi:hypothetical protein
VLGRQIKPFNLTIHNNILRKLYCFNEGGVLLCFISAFQQYSDCKALLISHKWLFDVW